MNGGHRCVAVLLGSLWQRVQAEVHGRGGGAALGSPSLYDNVRILLLCVCECVCIRSIGVRESRVVNAIVWV